MPGAGFYPIGASHITFGRDGSWYADGERITNRRIALLFSRHLVRLADGRYALVMGDEKASVEIEDTPWVVTRVDGHPDHGFRVTLNDETHEPLDPTSLAIEPDNARVWNSKGALLTELGRAEAALECLDRALELSASDAKVKAVFWLNKGKALFILKRYRESRDALVRSYQFDPSPESAAGIAACREHLEHAPPSTAVNAA